MEEPQDEWVRVGGKGRPRRTPEQQQKHLQDRAAAAAALAAVTGHSPQQHQESCYMDSDYQQQQHQQASTPEQQQAAQQQLQALAAAMAGSPPPKQPALPGWGPPPEREWKVACSSRHKKNRKQQQLPSTPQQQAQYVAQQVREIQSQLAASPVFKSLLQAMRQAAPGLSEGPDSSSSSSSSSTADIAVPQQHQQLQGDSGVDTRQQQQQQQQQQNGSSSSGPGWSWGEVSSLVVYGLGSPDDSKVSRHQLALVLLLQGLLPGLSHPPLLYDPAFSEADELLLPLLGLEVIKENEEGRRAVTGPTLFYLPHCEAVLTDNLLLANASPQQQSQLALLGNSFASYQARWAAPQGARPTTKRPDRLLQLVEAGAVRELLVPDHGYHVASAFNDMSLHTFTAAQ